MNECLFVYYYYITIMGNFGAKVDRVLIVHFYLKSVYKCCAILVELCQSIKRYLVIFFTDVVKEFVNIALKVYQSDFVFSVTTHTSESKRD